MITIFNKKISNKILRHILILLVSFLLSYTAVSSTNSKNSDISKALLIVHAPCDVLEYYSDLYALMDKFRKKSILITHLHDMQCEDFSLFKFDFIFKTSHKEYVKKEIKNYLLFNLDNNEAIKTEINEKIITIKNLIKNLEVGLGLYDVSGIDYNKLERSPVFHNLKISYHGFLRLNGQILKLKFEKRQLEKLLKHNGVKYDLNFIKLDERKNFGSFNNLFIFTFFLTALFYFLFYLLLTILPKFKSDFK